MNTQERQLSVAIFGIAMFIFGLIILSSFDLVDNTFDVGFLLYITIIITVTVLVFWNVVVNVDELLGVHLEGDSK